MEADQAAAMATTVFGAAAEWAKQRGTAAGFASMALNRCLAVVLEAVTTACVKFVKPQDSGMTLADVPRAFNRLLASCASADAPGNAPAVSAGEAASSDVLLAAAWTYSQAVRTEIAAAGETEAKQEKEAQPLAVSALQQAWNGILSAAQAAFASPPASSVSTSENSHHNRTMHALVLLTQAAQSAPQLLEGANSSLLSLILSCGNGLSVAKQAFRPLFGNLTAPLAQGYIATLLGLINKHSTALAADEEAFQTLCSVCGALEPLAYGVAQIPSTAERNATTADLLGLVSVCNRAVEHFAARTSLQRVHAPLVALCHCASLLLSRVSRFALLPSDVSLLVSCLSPHLAPAAHSDASSLSLEAMPTDVFRAFASLLYAALRYRSDGATLGSSLISLAINQLISTVLRLNGDDSDKEECAHWLARSLEEMSRVWYFIVTCLRFA